MKRILFYSIIVSLLLPGCSTSKRVHDTLHVATKATEQTDLHAESRQTTEAIAHTSTESTATEDGETRRIELEFDTALPVDSATGTPPLKRVTVTDTKRNSQKGTRRQTTTAAKQQTEVTVQDSNQTNIQIETVASQETQKKPRSLWWLWMIAGAALVGLVAWVWRRYRWRM